MSTAMTSATPQEQALDRDTLAKVLLTGDLEKLTDPQRMSLVMKVCETLGLNPMTQPFAFLRLSGKLVMYAKKDATEQLRKIHGVSITSITSERVDDSVFMVTATASDRSGRTDASTGAVAISNLKGEALANALMKAETKAKRRVTLSICGLGMLDETEVESIPNAEILPKVESVPLPVGAFQILNVVKQGAYTADVTYVDHAGVEDTLPMALDARDGGLSVLEKFQQNRTPVNIERVIGARDKKRKIKAVTAFTPAPVPPVTAAEIFKSEDVGRI